MASLLKYRGDVRQNLAFPSEHKLIDGYIDNTVIGVIDEIVTELNQTNEDWFLQPFSIQVQADKDTYNIEDVAPGFGKAHFFYTTDPSNPQHRRRPIPIVRFNELTTQYDAGDPGAVGVMHSAQAVAFYYDQTQGQQLMVVAPIPGASAFYKGIFEPMVVRPGALEEQANRLKQFDKYIADRAAYLLVHLCVWPELAPIEDPAQRERANAAKRAERLSTLGSECDYGYELLRRFKKSSNSANNFKVVPYGRGRR